jgi:exodeoxyribonuclease VII small subunit
MPADRLFLRVFTRILPHLMAAEKPASFEAALEELERIVQAMESGKAPLEESIASYERGVALLKLCQERLAGAEQKIRLLENGGLRDLASAGEEAEG